jgi:hypothetical protein
MESGRLVSHRRGISLSSPLYINYRKLWADSCNFSGIFSGIGKTPGRLRTGARPEDFSQSVELGGHYVPSWGGGRTMNGIDEVARLDLDLRG